MKPRKKWPNNGYGQGLLILITKTLKIKLNYIKKIMLMYI